MLKGMAFSPVSVMRVEEVSAYESIVCLHSLDKDKTARIGELVYSDVSVWSIVILDLPLLCQRHAWEAEHR